MVRFVTQIRKFVWTDPTSLDEDEFKEELSQNDNDWDKIISEQTTFGLLHYYDEKIVVVATELNKDGSPREVLILPRSILKYPKLG